jgi:hypothetical protein
MSGPAWTSRPAVSRRSRPRRCRRGRAGRRRRAPEARPSPLGRTKTASTSGVVAISRRAALAAPIETTGRPRPPMHAASSAPAFTAGCPTTSFRCRPIQHFSTRVRHDANARFVPLSRISSMSPLRCPHLRRLVSALRRKHSFRSRGAQYNARGIRSLSVMAILRPRDRHWADPECRPLQNNAYAARTNDPRWP